MIIPNQFNTTIFQQILEKKSANGEQSHDLSKSYNENKSADNNGEEMETANGTLKIELSPNKTIPYSSEPTQCEDCGKQFMFGKNIIRHKLTACKARENKEPKVKKPRVKKYKCVKCLEKFPDQQRLELHVSSCKVVCHICEKIFKDNRSLKTHLMVHGGERKFKCKFCEKGFNNRSNCM